MPVINVIVILGLIGVAVWAINTYVPMADPWKKLINVVAIIGTILWLLGVFGIWTGFTSTRIGH